MCCTGIGLTAAAFFLQFACVARLELTHVHHGFRAFHGELFVVVIEADDDVAFLDHVAFLPHVTDDPCATAAEVRLVERDEQALQFHRRRVVRGAGFLAVSGGVQRRSQA